jgi:hypothetical protein
VARKATGHVGVHIEACEPLRTEGEGGGCRATYLFHMVS